jgi:hypothetical protein
MKEEKDFPLKGFFRKIGIGLVILFILGIVFLIAVASETKDTDFSDNQKYIITVNHEVNVYNYFCSGYIKNPVNESFILYDWKKNPTNEIIVTNSVYFQVKLNPAFKPEYFETKKDSISTNNIVLTGF